MIISVTQDHIDRGIPYSFECCPVAYALKEQLRCGRGEEWSVTDAWAYLYKDGTRCKGIELPQTCRTFISCFDNNVTVEPFSFEVDYDF